MFDDFSFLRLVNLNLAFMVIREYLLKQDFELKILNTSSSLDHAVTLPKFFTIFL